MSTSLSQGRSQADERRDGTQDATERVVSKVLRRIMPLAILGLFVSYVDRTNISVAGPDMQAALGLTPSMFGLASGLFFVGYVLFEVPSNIALQRYGAKFWLARIMVTWGFICMATSLVTGPHSLYALRLLLGIGEAGFYPGILFYISLFVPVRHLARAYSVFQMGVPISLAIGSVLTTSLLLLDGAGGIDGWQWVMIIEGGMAVFVGVICYQVLASSPDHAKWLNEEEARLLKAAIAEDHPGGGNADHGWNALKQVLRSSAVWYYAFTYMLMLIGFYAVIYWSPQIIKNQLSVTSVQAGLLSAVPWVVTLGLLCITCRWTLSSKQKSVFIALTLLFCSGGLVVAALADNPIIGFIGLCAAASVQVAAPQFYSFPSQHFPGTQAAVALALVNSVGNIGGFIGPYLLGLLREIFHNDQVGLLFLAASLAGSALMAAGLERRLKRSH